jgi:exosome complex component RRP41
MMRKNTANKISAFVSKLDTSSKLLIANILDGTMSKADAIKQIDANIGEIQKIYKAVRTLASTKALFIKASKDDNFENAVSSITSIATRLDLVKQVAESLDDEEDYSDVSSDDILNDLGVEEEVEEEVVEPATEEEVVETEIEETVPTEETVEEEIEEEVVETEAEMEETIEEIIEEEVDPEAEEVEEEIEEEDGEVMFESSKKSSASVKKIKKQVSRIKKTNDAGVTGLFDFVK